MKINCRLEIKSQLQSISKAASLTVVGTPMCVHGKFKKAQVAQATAKQLLHLTKLSFLIQQEAMTYPSKILSASRLSGYFFTAKTQGRKVLIITPTEYLPASHPPLPLLEEAIYTSLVSPIAKAKLN